MREGFIMPPTSETMEVTIEPSLIYFGNVNLFVNYWFILSFKGYRFQRQPNPWITFPLTRLSKFFKSKKSIWLWSLTCTKCCWKGKYEWISPFVEWSPCMSCVLLSRLMSWKWSKHFKLDIMRERKYPMYLPWIGMERNNLLIPTLTIGMPIGTLKWKFLTISS
jgi:hypothetical protein